MWENNHSEVKWWWPSIFPWALSVPGGCWGWDKQRASAETKRSSKTSKGKRSCCDELEMRGTSGWSLGSGDSGDRSRSIKNEVASLVFSWGLKDKGFQRVCLKHKADLSGRCCQILKNGHGGVAVKNMFRDALIFFPSVEQIPPSDLPPGKRMWQTWWSVTFETRSKRHSDFHLAFSLESLLEKTTCHVRRMHKCPIERLYAEEMNNSQRKKESPGQQPDN